MNYQNDILLVSNFSKNLNKTEENIVENLPQNIKYAILTYRRSNIKNEYSFEEFLENSTNSSFDYKFFSKYNVNFYLSLVNERMLSNYNGEDLILGESKYSYEEILEFLGNLISFFERYIPKSKIIFSGYADNIFSTIVYQLCEYHNKKCFSFIDTNIVNNASYIISDDSSARPYDKLINGNSHKSYSELVDFLSRYDVNKDIKERSKKDKKIKLGIFGVVSPNIFSYEYLKYALLGYKKDRLLNIDKPSIYNKLIANIERLYNKIILKVYMQWQEKNFSDKYKYIYFPLQLQPEASTSLRSPYFMNLLHTIEQISKSLPLGYKLLVKEHPRAIGSRKLNFYRKIKSFHNVELVSMNIKSKEVLDACELIIGFGGTTLFEAIMKNKKVIILGDFPYVDFSLVSIIKEPSLLFIAIQKMLKIKITEEKSNKDMEKMLNYYNQRVFPRHGDFEKSLAENLLKILELEFE